MAEWLELNVCPMTEFPGMCRHCGEKRTALNHLLRSPGGELYLTSSAVQKPPPRPLTTEPTMEYSLYQQLQLGQRWVMVFGTGILPCASAKPRQTDCSAPQQPPFQEASMATDPRPPPPFFMSPYFFPSVKKRRRYFFLYGICVLN